MNLLLLGVDAGQTATKVALFDQAGRQVHGVATRSRISSPQPRWQERDMEALWQQTAAAIRRCLEEARVDPARVAAVGLCGHSDGLYLVDDAGDPVRPAVLATDSRATEQARRLGAGALGASLLELTGQVPFAGSPAALLSWFVEHEPRSLDRARWALFCKDWLRLRLTGIVSTDRTEASASFTDVRTQRWSDRATALTGADPRLLPPIAESDAVVGQVTRAASTATLLLEGTPVAGGSHDVDAAAIGVGAQRPGDLSVVLGTFSINQVVATAPTVDRRWQARSFVTPDQWMHMSTSAAGAANLDWVARNLGMLDATGRPDVASAIQRALATPRSTRADEDLTYLPFLYGSPFDGGGAPRLGAGFLGMHGWHTAGDLVRAVLEGVVHNHRTHVDFLRSAFDLPGAARVAGGGARSELWTGLLADALHLPVEVTDASEAGARGAALLAGTAIGVYDDLADGVAQAVRVVRRQDPGPGAGDLDRSYQRYRERVGALLHGHDGPLP